MTRAAGVSTLNAQLANMRVFLLQSLTDFTAAVFFNFFLQKYLQTCLLWVRPWVLDTLILSFASCVDRLGGTHHKIGKPTFTYMWVTMSLHKNVWSKLFLCRSGYLVREVLVPRTPPISYFSRSRESHPPTARRIDRLHHRAGQFICWPTRRASWRLPSLDSDWRPSRAQWMASTTRSRRAPSLRTSTIPPLLLSPLPAHPSSATLTLASGCVTTCSSSLTRLWCSPTSRWKYWVLSQWSPTWLSRTSQNRSAWIGRKTLGSRKYLVGSSSSRREFQYY